MSVQLQPYLTWLLVQYHHLKTQAYQHLLNYYPRFDNYNHFQKFIILNLTIIATYLILNFITSFSLERIYQRIVKLVFNLPPIRKYIKSQATKANQLILNDIPLQLRVEIQKIPYKTPQYKIGDESQKQSMKGKCSGSRYAPESHCKFVTNLAKYFSYANPLHSQTFPLVKQMEIEVITMSAEVIGLKDQFGHPCGTLNSGGTESILMAIYSYRQYKMKEGGVYKPNLVLCRTGHMAAIKACSYLGIQLRLVPYDENYQMNLSKMKSAIDDQTICVYTSYPNYPYGTCDPIDIIGPYCLKRDIPVHVDMCLGGFVCPFLQENWKLPPGITSVSADPHKYGLAGKGVSVLLFSSEKYRKHQFFVTSFWPGGLYGTPGVAGSRTGVYIASAWISMMKLGYKGFQENARLVRDAVKKVGGQFKKLGFQILNKRDICIISFRHKTISANAIHDFMKKKKWGFSMLQKPFAFQFSFTPLSATKTDDMIKDMKECVDYYTKNSHMIKETNEIALYGACAKIKDNGMKDYIMAKIMDTFLDLC